MTKEEMQNTLFDLFNQWNKAKKIAAATHPEWTEQQVNQAVSNAMLMSLQELMV
jgi:hypothetical protein